MDPNIILFESDDCMEKKENRIIQSVCMGSVVKNTNLETLYCEYLHKHGVEEITEEQRNLDPAYKIGCLMLETTAFSAAILYEILKCTISYGSYRVYIARLIDEKLVCAAKVTEDSVVNKIYYLTKKGFDKFRRYVNKCAGYRPVAKKRKETTALHDLGVTAVYSSLIRSPLKFNPCYEVITAHPKTIMPEGKQYRYAVRTDLVIAYGSQYSVGKIYNEHDTGSETIIKALNKVYLYAVHNMLREPVLYESGRWRQDMILYSFRRKYGDRPKCFKKSEVKKLLSYMTDVTRINSLRKSEYSSLIWSFEQYTPALTEGWNRQQIEKYLSDLEGRVNVYFNNYLYAKQLHFAQSRRNGMLEYILKEFNRLNEISWDGTRYLRIYQLEVMVEEYKYKGYFGREIELWTMMRGFPIIVCPYNAVNRFLAVFFFREHKGENKWIIDALQSYYGMVEYWQENMLFAKGGGLQPPDVIMHNIFKTKMGRYVAVEYFSCDLSAIVRVYALHNTLRRENEKYEVVLVVDSICDTKNILFLLGIRCVSWIHFVEYGNNRLFHFYDEGTVTYI